MEPNKSTRHLAAMRPTTITNVRVPPARLLDLPKAIGATHSPTDAVRLLEKNRIELPAPRSPEAASVFKFLHGKTLTRSESQNLSYLVTRGNRPQNVALLAEMHKCNPSFEPVLDLLTNGMPGRPLPQIAMEIGTLLAQAREQLPRFGVRVWDHMSPEVLQQLENFHADASSPIVSVHVLFDPGLPPAMNMRDRISDWLQNCGGALECISGASNVLHLIENSVPELELHLTEIDAQQAPGEILNLTLQLEVGQLTLVGDDDDPQPLLNFANFLQAHNSTAGADERLHAVELKGPLPDRCAQVVQGMMAIPHIYELTLPDPRWLSMKGHELLAWADGSSLRSLTISDRMGFDLDSNAPGGRHLRAQQRFGALAQRLSNILERNRVADRMVGIEVSKAFSRHAPHSHGFDDLVANNFVAQLRPRDIKSMSLVNKDTINAVEVGHSRAEAVKGTVQGIAALAKGPRAEVPPLPQEPAPPDHA